ncbi:hypothetical protein ACSBR2_034636 [Camellia fascicularis]
MPRTSHSSPIPLRQRLNLCPRPVRKTALRQATTNRPPPATEINIPVIDLSDLFSPDRSIRSATARLISRACREWGFFQVVNHGVSHELMKRNREVWREFFELPLEEKQAYVNSPATYEGKKRGNSNWRGSNDSNGCWLAIRSDGRPDDQDYLGKAFGGEEVAACMRVNFYPKCPQPDLTLGLSSHLDPGGMTLLHSDDHVAGLQVRRGDDWVAVKPVPNAFIVNIGYQIQILSNATYKSVEHRVIVNSAKERVSLAFFYNPNGNILIEPASELATEDSPGAVSGDGIQQVSGSNPTPSCVPGGPLRLCLVDRLRAPRLVEDSRIKERKQYVSCLSPSSPISQSPHLVLLPRHKNP